MVKRIQNEPALVSGLVSAAISLGVSFGMRLSADQVGAIMAVVSALLAIFVRQNVTTNA